MSRACKECGCPLWFVKSDKGGIIPLDTRTPVYSVVKEPGGEPTAIRVQEKYVSHFNTCPKASKFSQKGKA